MSQNSSATAVGIGGCGQGYEGIGNSLVVEFDLYYNDSLCPETNDPSDNHLGIMYNGSRNHTTPSLVYDIPKTQLDMKDGLVHLVTITYVSATTTLTVKIDNAVTWSASVNLAQVGIGQDGTMWVGLTGGTFLARQNHNLRSWRFRKVLQQPVPSHMPTPAPRLPSTLTPTPTATASPATACTFDMTTSNNKTADVFRAPIEGNPVEGRITLKNSNTVGPYLATANGFAVDGITRNLWLHVRSDDLLWRWVRVKAASGESYEIPIPGESLNAVVPVEGMAGIDPVELTEAEVSSCVSAASSNRTAQYPLANVPWTLPATPFDWMPLSTDSICQNSGGINQIWGFGLYDINRYALRLPKGYHPGVDFFGYIPATSATSVYSIGDMGIVVGIGINEDNVDSAANWGSSNLVEDPGYSIIVRYGHLYVLYGHLREVDPSIYVGKQVSKAARLGAIGTYDAEGDLISEPHLHLEIRTFGEAVASGALVIQDGKTKGNIFGILKLGGTQAVPLYDIAQLFAPVAFAYVQDFGASDSTATVVPSIATVTSLGALLEGGSSVIFGPFCSIQYLLALTTPSSTQTMSPTPRINNFRINTVLRQTPASIRSLRNGENPSVGIDPAITPDPQSYQ